MEVEGGVSPEMTPYIRSFKTFVAANMLFLLQGRTSSHHLTDDKPSEGVSKSTFWIQP